MTPLSISVVEYRRSEHVPEPLLVAGADAFVRDPADADG
jgi:hypothetical protein